MRQTACLVINPTSVDRYASLFKLHDSGLGLTLNDGLDIKLSQVGRGLMLCLWLSLAWPTVVQLVVSFNSGLQWGISQEYSFFVLLQ